MNHVHAEVEKNIKNAVGNKMNYINDKVSYNLSGLNQFEGKTEEIDEILTCMNLIVNWVH